MYMCICILVINQLLKRQGFGCILISKNQRFEYSLQKNVLND